MAKTGPLDQGQGTVVAGLNVGLHPVKTQDGEGVSQRQLSRTVSAISPRPAIAALA